jgi:hypothetical protein
LGQQKRRSQKLVSNSGEFEGSLELETWKILAADKDEVLIVGMLGERRIYSAPSPIANACTCSAAAFPVPSESFVGRVQVSRRKNSVQDVTSLTRVFQLAEQYSPSFHRHVLFYQCIQTRQLACFSSTDTTSMLIPFNTNEKTPTPTIEIPTKQAVILRHGQARNYAYH